MDTKYELETRLAMCGAPASLHARQVVAEWIDEILAIKDEQIARLSDELKIAQHRLANPEAYL